jgi:hypothetical protein
MHKMPATSWARINPRLSSPRTAAASKIVRRPTKASTRRLTVLKSLFCLAAVVPPIVTLTTAALADDDKIYVGAECRLFAPGNEPVGLRADGAMFNISQVEQTWICPVVRDEEEQDPEFARITVLENGLEGEENKVRCEFEARGPKGEPKLPDPNPNIAKPTKSSEDVYQPVPLQHVVVYTWGGGDDNVLNDVPDHGYYFFRCAVPGMAPPGAPPKGLSGVITYKVSEED